MRKYLYYFTVAIVAATCALASVACGGSGNSDKSVGVTGVAVSPSALTLSVGQTQALNAKILPENASNKGVSWSSSNPGAATVDGSGIVRAVADGAASIKVTTDDGGFNTICAVTVRNPVTSVTLDRETLTLKMNLLGGASESLAVTVAPETATNKNVRWTSSPPGVVSVSPIGVVTPLSIGKTIVTVTSEDGGHTASCAVNVSLAYFYVESVTVLPATATLTMGDALQLDCAILPVLATDKTLGWLSNNTAVADVDNGRVRALAPGYARITATSVDGSNKAGYCDVQVRAPIPVTGVSLKSKMAIPLNRAVTLTAKIEPADAYNKTLSWTSSNTNIVAVDSVSGLMSAKAKGAAEITAKTQDGGYEATCSISVVNVYMAGGSLLFNRPQVLINDEYVRLLSQDQISGGMQGMVESMFITDAGDIYVSGWRRQGESGEADKIAMVWKNGGFYQDLLNTSNLNFNIFDLVVPSIAVSGGDVYAAGYCHSEDQTLDWPKLWKNGEEQDVEAMTRGRAYSLAPSNDGVYMTGSTYVPNAPGPGQDAIVWKNGQIDKVLKRLGVYANAGRAIAVSGNDVYVAGTSYDYDFANGRASHYCALWKNDEAPRSLPVWNPVPGWMYSEIRPNCIFVDGADVYVGGALMLQPDPPVGFAWLFPVIWKNDAIYYLGAPGTDNDVMGEVYSIYVVDDTVFTAGAYYEMWLGGPMFSNTSAYWIDGVMYREQLNDLFCSIVVGK